MCECVRVYVRVCVRVCVRVSESVHNLTAQFHFKTFFASFLHSDGKFESLK